MTIDQRELQPVLLKAPLFEALSERSLQRVVEKARHAEYKKESYLFLRADPAEYCFLLVSGQVKLELSNRKGDQIAVQHVLPGGAFALVGAFQSTRYPLSAYAMKASAALIWPVQEFNALCQEDPVLHANSTRIIADRSIEFQGRLLELSSEKVERRVAHALLRLAQHLGKKQSGCVVLDLDLSRQDLAELSGTTLFTASRTLSKLQDMDIIQGTRKHIVIQDVHGLVEFAEDLPSKYPSLLD